MPSPLPCYEVTPARFERAAYGLGNRRSIHLSYGVVWLNIIDSVLNRSPLHTSCAATGHATR